MWFLCFSFYINNPIQSLFHRIDCLASIPTHGIIDPRIKKQLFHWFHASFEAGQNIGFFAKHITNSQLNAFYFHCIAILRMRQWRKNDFPFFKILSSYKMYTYTIRTQFIQPKGQCFDRKQLVVVIHFYGR